MRLPEMPVNPTNIPSELRDLPTIAGRRGKASVTCRSYLWAVLPFAACSGLEPLMHCLLMLLFKPSVGSACSGFCLPLPCQHHLFLHLHTLSRAIAHWMWCLGTSVCSCTLCCLALGVHLAFSQPFPYPELVV